MQFQFDPKKDQTNVEKHEVSLSMALALDWDAALVWVDGRREYGETREVALAPHMGVLYVVAFVDRGPIRRVISLRRANRREVRRYVQVIKESSDPDA